MINYNIKFIYLKIDNNNKYQIYLLILTFSNNFDIKLIFFDRIQTFLYNPDTIESISSRVRIWLQIWIEKVN